MKTSIHSKILRLNLSVLLLCAVFVGGFGILCASHFVKDDTQEHLQLISQRESARISARLQNIEQYVKTVSYVVLDGLDDLDELKDTLRQQAFTDYNLNFMRATIHNVNSAVAVYLRYNPKFTPPTSGVFLAKTSKNGNILKQVPTDFSKYDPSDIEHVGWYYVPVISGKPIWMDPYENKNVDIYMISYVMPLVKFGTEVGVVGVDIDFGFLTSEIASISFLESGYAYLENKNGTVIYHPSLSRGSRVPDNFRRVCVKRFLSNGMVLVLEVPASETNMQRDALVAEIMGFTFIILLVFGLISVRMARSITEPLTALTESANQMVAGNIDVSLEFHSDDEVEDLARNFAAIRKYVKEYMGFVRGVAFKDGLTGVRNKTAFDTFLADLQNKVNMFAVTELGFVSFDVNNLKKVNECSGHDHGDLLLQNACQIICQVFGHSPVFRVGGDEFVAVLQYEDYRNREALLAEMDRKMAATRSEDSAPWDRISIAKGLAVYNCYTNEPLVDAVQRAHDAMYENKRAMKSFG